MGVDVHAWKDLPRELILDDPTCFPFGDGSFDSVTFIACLNHVPGSLRDRELREAHRCLKPGGRVIITMGHPIAEVLVHRLVRIYDAVLGTQFDRDSQRGMEAEEDYYLTRSEIVSRLAQAGFENIRYRPFVTQWGLNGVYVARKQAKAPDAMVLEVGS